jgi:hypothetical protein
MHSLRYFFDTIRASFLLSICVQPRTIKPLRPMAHFWWALLCGAVLAIALQLFQFRQFPIRVTPDGLMADAFFATLTLGVCVLMLSRFKKTHLAFSLATFLLIAQWLPAVLWTFAYDRWQAHFNALGQAQPFFMAMLGGYTFWFLLTCFSTLKFFQLLSKRVHRLALAVVMVSLMVWPYLPQSQINLPRYVAINSLDLLPDEADMQPPKPQFDAEALMYAQHDMLHKALEQIKIGDAGTPELFVIAVAGDGKEDTFLNEAVYVRSLFSARFGARQRVLVLANHPETTAELPLASLTNLRAGLRGVAKKMQPEDALLLFMTSHGAPPPSHEFELGLMPLPLNQVNPKQLSAALAASGIARQWVIVSACYSGGYLDALANENRIVMTAARADRPSFGCGNTQDMTFFGQAFLRDALNQQDDLLKAFQVAQTAITAREKKEGFEPSLPQIRIGENARKHLLEWKKSFEPGDPVPFFVALDNKR